MEERTNALRTGTAKEISNAMLVTVELAAGCTQLYQDPITGTLLATSEVEPIFPLRGLVSLGYRIKWDGRGCTIYHPRDGKLQCWLRNGCPVVKEVHALKLIHEIEELEREKHVGPKNCGGCGEGRKPENGGRLTTPKFLKMWWTTWWGNMISVLKGLSCHGTDM